MTTDHWPPGELESLMLYRKNGVKFPDIAKKLGRSQLACENRYNYEVGKRREARLKLLRERRDLADGGVPPCNPSPKPSVATEPSTSSPTVGHSTILANGGDTRDIAARGAAAVMFGDPPPGRSALDQRNKELNREKK